MEDSSWSVGRSVAAGVLTTLLVAGAFSGLGRNRAAQERGLELSRYERAVLRAEQNLPVAAQNEFARHFESVGLEGGSALAAAEGHALAAKGLLRLDDEDLLNRIRLISVALDRVPVETCAAYMKGIARPSDQIRLVSALDSAGLEAWVEMSLRSSLYEIRQDPPLRWASENQIQAAGAVLMDRLTEDQQELLLLGAEENVTASSTQKCASAKLFLGEIVRLPRTEGASLARMLAEPLY